MLYDWLALAAAPLSRELATLGSSPTSRASEAYWDRYDSRTPTGIEYVGSIAHDAGNPNAKVTAVWTDPAGNVLAVAASPTAGVETWRCTPVAESLGGVLVWTSDDGDHQWTPFDRAKCEAARPPDRQSVYIALGTTVAVFIAVAAGKSARNLRARRVAAARRVREMEAVNFQINRIDLIDERVHDNSATSESDSSDGEDVGLIEQSK